MPPFPARSAHSQCLRCSHLQPIYLFADSQLLFWKDKELLFLTSLKEWLTPPAPKAAYIGASNGDHPAFYAIFAAAMAGIGIAECRLIRSSFLAEDQTFLQHADLILLAGGEVEQGWNILQGRRISDLILKRYAEGTLLIGVSAGAVHLGLGAPVERAGQGTSLIATLQVVPFLIDVHAEQHGWEQLRRAIRLLDGTAKAIGIPAGGGGVYYPDGTLEAIRYPLHEFSKETEQARSTRLIITKSC